MHPPVDGQIMLRSIGEELSVRSFGYRCSCILSMQKSHFSHFSAAAPLARRKKRSPCEKSSIRSWGNSSSAKKAFNSLLMVLRIKPEIGRVETDMVLYSVRCPAVRLSGTGT